MDDKLIITIIAVLLIASGICYKMLVHKIAKREMETNDHDE